MGNPTTYQDDLKVLWLPEDDLGSTALDSLTEDDVTEAHEFAEIMADGFATGNTQNVVAEEMLVGGQVSSDIGSEQYQPNFTFRYLDADNDDLDVLARGESGVILELPTGSTSEGAPYNAYLVRSAGPATQDSSANAYQKRNVSCPARKWYIGGELGAASGS